MSSRAEPAARIWDISPTIDGDLQVWPGDTEPSREVLLDLDRGDNLTLSTLRSTVHCGAHVDAPSHYGKDAPTVDAWDLQRFVGPCRVVRPPRSESRARDGGVRIPASAVDSLFSKGDAAAQEGHERILFATGSYPDPTRFEQGFDALSVELIERMAGNGTRLVGIDTPSVDLFSSKDLPAHQACLRGELAILEGLVLTDVPEGLYELIALPLKLAGFDASPVRAILRETRQGVTATR